MGVMALPATIIDTRPGSSGNKFRRKRLARFMALVNRTLAEKSECRILDAGGTYEYWHAFRDMWEQLPVSVTMVNPVATHSPDPRIVSIAGDARAMPQFADNSFDIVHSNSVIEHVGVWNDMRAMANEVRRLAPRYFVQVPYFWFPLEPHNRVPFFHWMPVSWRIRILMARDNGFWKKAENVDEAMELVESAVLPDARQLRALFPDAEIARERTFLLTKSLMAIRG